MDNTNSKTQAYDPGWNDPPKLSYSMQQTPPNRPRNFLNKRVAFPLVSNSTGPSTVPANLANIAGAPPIPTLPPVLPPISTEPITNPAAELTSTDSQNTLNETKETLLHFLESSSELGPKASDIKRRIGMMEDMWLSGKLNGRIHQQMKELANAIRDDMPSKADDIHRALMVDHVNVVGTWMPGVKQLIHHCIARSDLLSIDKHQPNEEN